MTKLFLAATTVIILAAGTAPSFADISGSSNTFEQCANILANRQGYPASMVAYCGGSHRVAHRSHPMRTAPAMRDDGPSVNLPG